MKIIIDRYQLLKNKAFENVKWQRLPEVVEFEVEVVDVHANSLEIEAMHHLLIERLHTEMYPDATNEL